MPLPEPSAIPGLTPHVGVIPPDALFETSLNPGSRSVRYDQMAPGQIGGATLIKNGGLGVAGGSGFWSNAAVNAVSCPGFGSGSVSGYALYYPFLASRTATLSKIGFCQTSVGGAGSALHVGLYEATSNVDPYPSALIVDSGDLDASNAGLTYTVVSYTLPVPATLVQGRWYWLAFEQNAALVTANTNICPGLLSSCIMTPYGRAPDPFHGASGMANGFALTRSYSAFGGTFPAGKSVQGPSLYAPSPDSNFMPGVLPEVLMQFTA